LILGGFAARAADVKTLLACRIGAATPAGQILDIANTTPAPLKTETVVNLIVHTAGQTPGESDSCFALAAPLAAKAHVSHTLKLGVPGAPRACEAFVSSKIPAVIHGADGSTMTQCDY